jgi:hypothetical protein
VSESPDSLLQAQPSRAMRKALAALLDQVPGAREVLLPLAALENMLKTIGLAGIGRISTPALVRVCAQITTLPVREDDQALQALISLLGGELAQRERAAQPRSARPSTLDNPARLEVGEASMSDFLDAAGGRPLHP